MTVTGRLVEVLRSPGPWCTVHVGAATGTVDSLEAMDLLDGRIRDTLAAAGADKLDVAAAAALTRRAEGVPGPCSRFVLISGGEVRINEVLPGAPPVEVIDVGAIPNLLPLLRMTNTELTYAVVEAERAEAEMRLYRASTAEPLAHEEVHGDTENLKKVPGGGLSQGRYQYRTQEIWRRNAGEMAAVVEAAVTAHRAGLVIVSGDVRARQLLLGELGTATASLTRVIDMNSRPAGADADKFEAEVQRLVAEEVALRQQAALDRLAGADAEYRAVGWGETIRALQLAQVETLFLETGAPADKSALALDSAPWLATTDEDALSAEVLGTASGAAALVRAALLTDADVQLSTSGALGPLAPLAAILRWPTGMQREA